MRHAYEPLTGSATEPGLIPSHGHLILSAPLFQINLAYYGGQVHISSLLCFGNMKFSIKLYPEEYKKTLV